jgi:uncharacterized protein YutD
MEESKVVKATSCGFLYRVKRTYQQLNQDFKPPENIKRSPESKRPKLDSRVDKFYLEDKLKERDTNVITNIVNKPASKTQKLPIDDYICGDISEKEFNKKVAVKDHNTEILNKERLRVKDYINAYGDKIHTQFLNTLKTKIIQKLKSQVAIQKKLKKRKIVFNFSKL